MGLLDSIRFWYAAIRDGLLLFLYIFYTYLGVIWHYFIPRKPKSLKNEVILVAGSANGIGRQVCIKLAKSGAKLICWDISKRENTALIIELKRLGADVYGYEVDVSDMNQVQRVANQVREDIGDVTILINNAGIMPVHPFLSHNPREVSRAFQVNVFGPLWLLREFLPPMIEKEVSKGHVITICSFGGLIGSRNLAAYCGTKHAVNGIIESLRDEVRVHPNKPNIKFTTVYASVCSTSSGQNVIHSRFPWLLPKMTDPEYIAEKTLEGILMELDYVYIPPVLNLLSRIIKAFPSKIYWAINEYFNYYVEPKEVTRVIGGVQENGTNSK